MLLNLLFLAVGASARVINRAALATNEGLQLTQIHLTDAVTGNTTLEFNVYDPDPLTLANTTCTGSWPHGGAFPSEYELCQDGNFTYRLDAYKNIQSFAIGLTHRFKDPSIGDPPYDSLRVFAKAVVNETVLVVSNNGTSAMQKNGTSLEAPIYAIIA